MKITICTLFPNMIKGFLNESMLGRAQKDGKVNIEIVNIRDFAIDDYGTVDDRPYGGGAGMVLMAKPVASAIKFIRSSKSGSSSKSTKVVLTTPRGTPYSQEKAQEFARLDNLIIIAGHYEAIDERVMAHVDEEVSIGDYVLTGGELPAAVITDSIIRLLPGVLQKSEAAEIESFFSVDIHEVVEALSDDDEGDRKLLASLQKNGQTKVQLLEYPHYTRPRKFEDQEVPEVLTQGHHKEIRRWQMRQAYFKTKANRPDLLRKR